MNKHCIVYFLLALTTVMAVATTKFWVLSQDANLWIFSSSLSPLNLPVSMKTCIYNPGLRWCHAEAGYLPWFFKSATAATPWLCCKADNHIALSPSLIPAGVYSETFLTPFFRPTHTPSSSPPSSGSHLVPLWVLRSVAFGLSVDFPEIYLN